MDKHANIHFDGNKFTVTDRNGKPIGNTIFNRHRRADAFRDALTANTDSDGNAGAILDAILDAYRDANEYAAAYGYAY
jgi:transposase